MGIVSFAIKQFQDGFENSMRKWKHKTIRVDFAKPSVTVLVSVKFDYTNILSERKKNIF